MSKPDPRARAERMAYSLGITLFLREDGTIAQNPPGEKIKPPPSALPTDQGHTPYAVAAAKP
jgi:hypothetical protein